MLVPALSWLGVSATATPTTPSSLGMDLIQDPTAALGSEGDTRLMSSAHAGPHTPWDRHLSVYSIQQMHRHTRPLLASAGISETGVSPTPHTHSSPLVLPVRTPTQGAVRTLLPDAQECWAGFLSVDGLTSCTGCPLAFGWHPAVCRDLRVLIPVL